MAAMHYEGNFNAERNQLSTIDETVSRELAQMEQTLEELSTFWKDEKSGPFITDTRNFIKLIRGKQGMAIQKGNDILNKVEEALHIYVD